MQSRINPSMRMANVKPFEEERVAPGLGLGYTTEGSQGFNSGMMERESWMPKDVDQMRVLTNPRAGGVSLVGHEGPANGITQNVPTVENMGNMEKHRPDRDFEMSEDRYMTTTGLEKDCTFIPIDRHVTRPETTTSYTGVASAEQILVMSPVNIYLP